jgi:ribonuclease P protein component
MAALTDRKKLSKSDITALFKKGKRLRQPPYFDLIYTKALDGTGHLIIVTSRLIGPAPERNKIRRRMKAIFHEHSILDQGMDYIFIIKKEALELSFDELKKLVLQTIEPISIQKDGHA